MLKSSATFSTTDAELRPHGADDAEKWTDGGAFSNRFPTAEEQPCKPRNAWFRGLSPATLLTLVTPRRTGDE